MRELLVILGSTQTGLAVARVARRRGFEVVILDTLPGPARWTRLARFELITGGRDDAVMRRIAAIQRAGSRTMLIADSDRWLRFIAAHHDEITSHGVLILHPAAERIRLCLDKSAFLRWCRDQELPAPAIYDATQADGAADWAFPLLLRPQETLHSSPVRLPKACIVENAAELHAWLARFRSAGVVPTVCESLVGPGVRQISVGAARSADGKVRLFFAEKLRPLAERCAGGTLVRSIADPGVADLATAALTRLDYFGVAEVEILYQPEEGVGRLVEVNARPWLQFGLPWTCGQDLIGHALGESHDPGSRAELGVSWLYFWSDAYQCFSRGEGMYARGEISIRGYLRDLLSARTYALWDRGDPLPFLMRAVAG